MICNLQRWTESAKQKKKRKTELLVEQMLKGNLFDLKTADGGSSDAGAGGAWREGRTHPLESAKWIENSSPKSLYGK